MHNFVLSDEQEAKFDIWLDEHRQNCVEPKTAIGGAMTYKFVPTSLGDFVSAYCFCGAQCDLNDYESF